LVCAAPAKFITVCLISMTMKSSTVDMRCIASSKAVDEHTGSTGPGFLGKVRTGQLCPSGNVHVYVCA